MWIRAYNLFKQSILPNDGGWLSQTDKYIKLMLFMDSKVEGFKQNYGKKK